MTKEQHLELNALKATMDKAIAAADKAKNFKTRVEAEYPIGGNLQVNLSEYSLDSVTAFVDTNEEVLRGRAEEATTAYEEALARYTVEEEE